MTPIGVLTDFFAVDPLVNTKYMYLANYFSLAADRNRYLNLIKDLQN